MGQGVVAMPLAGFSTLYRYITISIIIIIKGA